MSYNLEQYNNNTFVTIQRYDTFDTVCQKCKIIAIVKTGINSFIGIWLYFICSKLNIIGKTLIGVHKWSHSQCNAIAMKQGCPTQKKSAACDWNARMTSKSAG